MASPISSQTNAHSILSAVLGCPRRRPVHLQPCGVDLLDGFTVSTAVDLGCGLANRHRPHVRDTVMDAGRGNRDAKLA